MSFYKILYYGIFIRKPQLQSIKCDERVEIPPMKSREKGLGFRGLEARSESTVWIAGGREVRSIAPASRSLTIFCR